MTLVNQQPGMNVLSGDALSPLSGSICPGAAEVGCGALDLGRGCAMAGRPVTILMVYMW